MDILIIALALIALLSVTVWRLLKRHVEALLDESGSVTRAEFEAFRAAHEIDRLSWESSRRRFDAVLNAILDARDRGSR